MVLPSLFINIAVPVSFFHLERALGSGLAGPGVPAGTPGAPFSGAGAATPPLLLLLVTATVGTTGLEAAKIVRGIVWSQKSFLGISKIDSLVTM